MAVGLKPANKLVQGAAIPGAMGHQADQAAMEDRVVQAVAVGAAQTGRLPPAQGRLPGLEPNAAFIRREQA